MPHAVLRKALFLKHWKNDQIYPPILTEPRLTCRLVSMFKASPPHQMATRKGSLGHLTQMSVEDRLIGIIKPLASYTSLSFLKLESTGLFVCSYDVHQSR